MTSRAPTGTVTFLFTDIEASTRLWQQHGGAMDVALARHDEILRRSIEAHRGVVFSTAGDAFAAAFWTADDALAAAMAAQDHLAAELWPAPVVIRVRMGLHTGPAVERDGDYFGHTLNRAARLMAAAHGGQVLASDTTATLLGRLGLRDLGEHQLKDLPGTERVWQAGPGDYPPLRCAPGRVGNLPRARATFIGRTDDRERLGAALVAGRVVTLTGVGGAGKTRLSLAVAESHAGAFPDGTWWCDLAPLADPSGVVAHVAATLTVTLPPGGTPIEAIVDSLRGRRALIVFDNCEHVLAGAAELVMAIVSGCETVAVLATSREPLGIEGEHVWPLRPLHVESEAVDLLLERAIAADATFVAGDRSVLVELCRHLDGIPLAIELAAARLRTLAPSELLVRLGDRFTLLRGRGPGTPDRHRTLAATLDWSYGLLGADEQALFDRLAVFAGDFDVTAVQRVCTDGPHDPVEVIDLLAGMVDKSMISIDRTRNLTRYRLLETVRHYSSAHAAEQGTMVSLRERHLAHYVAVAELAGAEVLADYTIGRVVFDTEWNNIRAATQFAIATADTESVERMFAAMVFHAVYCLRYEVLDWAEQATALRGAGPAPFGTGAWMAGMLGRFEEADRLARAGIAAASQPLDRATWACWTALYVSVSRSGTSQSAQQAATAAHETSTLALGDAGDALWAAMRAFAEARSDPDGAAELSQRAEALLPVLHSPAVRADVLARLGRYYGLIGEPQPAIEYCRQALALAEAHDIPFSRNNARTMLARLAAGGVEDPTPLFRDAIAGAYRDRFWVYLWPTVRALGRWWATHGQDEPAAVISGHLEAQGLGVREEAAGAELAVGPDIARWHTLGARFDRDQLVAYILARLPAAN